PFLHLVDWRRSPSVYGPVFNLFSAVGAVVAGPSLLLARLWHQCAAALALVVALVVVWRRTREPAALAWLGLHPLIVVLVVNEGHNDLLVGVALLLAVVALEARHQARSGAAIAGGALVKITAGLALIGATAWAATQRARPRAWAVVVAAAVVLGVGYLPIAGQALAPITSHSALVSRASLWQVPNVVLGIGTTRVLRALPFAGAAVVLALAVFVALRRRDDAPVLAVAGSVASYQAVAPYVLPWYCAWSLPSLALRRDSALARWGWWYAALLATIYQIPIGPSPTAARYERPIVGALFPAIAVVTFVLAARAKDGQRRRSGRATVSPAPSTAP
ncbi:MAG TPA: glycosyltransferase 87 family protein, partial [Gemmatimonadaceae bacterium]|nr:glycosyltransferase 87 family protein [Gemmatimonadaceae bacterium]